MSSHGHGKGRICVSTTIPQTVYQELAIRARTGGWRSTAAYMRAVLIAHCRNRLALAQQETFYNMDHASPARAAESRAEYDPRPPPGAPACCPLARANTANRGNGDADNEK
jgi:hypothetical protein